MFIFRFKIQVQQLELALTNSENEERNLRNKLKLILNKQERDFVLRSSEDLKVKLEGYNLRKLVQEINGSSDQLDQYKNRVGYWLSSIEQSSTL